MLYQVQKTILSSISFVFENLLSLIHVADKALRTEKASLCTEIGVVTSTTMTLENMKHEQAWNNIWRDVLSYTENVRIMIEGGQSQTCSASEGD